MNFGVGDMVVVLSGAWEGTVGTVQSMNEQKKSLSINVELFGRDTPVELSFSEVKKNGLKVSGRGLSPTIPQGGN